MLSLCVKKKKKLKELFHMVKNALVGLVVCE